MTYCKVVINGNVVDVGCAFLKWNAKRHKMSICDVDEGQFLQSYNEENIYRDTWMKPTSPEANGYLNAEITVINLTEYTDIKALLQEGEEIVEEIPEEIPQQQTERAPEEEKPLSISEMREIIARQQKQIELLMKKIK